MRVADLFEAEGRTLRHSLHAEARLLGGQIAGLGVSLAFLIAAITLLLLGILLVGTAGFLWLQDTLDTTAAAAITGAGFLFLGVIALWMFHSKATPSRAKP